MGILYNFQVEFDSADVFGGIDVQLENVDNDQLVSVRNKLDLDKLELKNQYLIDNLLPLSCFDYYKS